MEREDKITSLSNFTIPELLDMLHNAIDKLEHRGEVVSIEDYVNWVDCPICDGKGTIGSNGFITCDICHGRGILPNMKDNSFVWINGMCEWSICSGSSPIPVEFPKKYIKKYTGD